ncbi:efflux RND transporter permease subunit [Geosporobacter ferrireducens]|uniref:Multidrug ABC transporter n=1 Tax=Geosporobacter ferrireducens TaxID=1424294 RepID=A0A1D8GFM6_9FIRM|nr:efflux RND transporter permease subunit [Geosporobacter ferrireducens]AOT69712.1 multidrug ABC transporter [Geosporobacter ferrireducens]MTI54580.1 efflux RND transporter permease subunit [Geosporobacter ferrireducens]
MNLSSISVKRPVTIVMMTLIVVVLGVISLTRIPIDLMPKIEVPVAIVSTTYSGVGPQEIEELITRPLENAVATVSGIDSLQSISTEGSSLVIAQFDFGTDMDNVALEMREKVDMVKGMLPSDANTPMVMKIDPNAQPIIQLALTDGDDLAKLQTFAEDTVKPRLERLPGVASVSVTGGYTDQIEIAINQEKLTGYGLTVDQIAQVLRTENYSAPTGEVKTGAQKLTIRTTGEFKSLEAIQKLPVSLSGGSQVLLEDIATVTMKYKDETSISRTNGKRSINVSMQKQSGTNTVTVADKIAQELEKLKKEFPEVEIVTVMDQSTYIKDAIGNVSNSAMMGGILAVVVLYMFLRNLRTTFIIGVAIPVSVIATFILLFFNDITINMMTLGGLSLGVGMLVDNSIVVLENIYRYRQMGYSRVDAAVKGAQEVGMAVVASTLTTVAVFLPIAFVEGLVSILFKELSLTVAMSLGASLVISLTLVPMLSSKLLKVDTAEGKGRHGRFKLFNFLYDAFDKGFEKVESGYRKLLAGALNRRKTTVFVAFVIFAGSLASIAAVGMEFFPASDEGQISISIEMPNGYELENVDELTTKIEGMLEGIGEVETIFSNIGSSGNSFRGGGSNKASVYVMLKKMAERERSTIEVADEIREMIKDIPGAKLGVSASNSMSFSGGSPVNIKIKGDDLDTLKKIGEDIKNIVMSVEGTREVKNSLEEGIPEVEIQVNRDVAVQYGLTAAQIASAVKGTVAGQTATKYRMNGEEIDVVIKGDSIFQESLSNLGQISVPSSRGSVPLNQVARIAVVQGPISINREDQVRITQVNSQVFGRDLGSISRDIQAKLAQYPMPSGYTYELGGDNQQMIEAFQNLLLALGLAIVIMYMIMASQFESLIHPFTVMFSVPLAFSGGALGLFITGRTLSVTALIGVIMLSGIVVNNAIVLVDYINTRRAEGEERREAIINAGPIRLRPILMTTLTTVLGLLPLAIGIGEGAESQAPMATVVIGGLALSTLLTLVFVPVMYTLLDDFKNFIKRKILRRKPVQA